MKNTVNVRYEKINIPTYEVGTPEVNPLFFDKRIYQGSSGKVYPVPFIDKVNNHKVDKIYQAGILENEYIKLVVLPEIGGRIFEAQDKTNKNYDFFYRQDVIKPALVGLAGPWLSGGVEFNWPQHHRPGTFLPTDTHIEIEKDGAKTFWMSEYDPMNRLKGMHGIRLRAESSLIELRVRLFNPTPLTQTFLWWANVAVEVHKDYRSFFPPDVHYVADHAVRATSSFPLAENDYYDIPYHNLPGKNDLRNYDNIPVPTSYMVCESKYNFFGGYDFKQEGGFIHVANRHIAPGKKQWTWGSAEFGQAWDRELTDTGGPYFELMAGVYTDNQPDFSYLLPYETKTFSQFWWSYKNLGPVQNANNDCAIRLELQQGNKLDLGVATSSKLENLKIVLQIGSNQTIFNNITITPESPWMDKSKHFESGQEYAISLSVINESGKELLTYHHIEVSKERNRKVAIEPKDPNQILSANELELVGEHLEQYRHPTRYPEPYWKEAIKRDPKSYKSFIALGKVALKSGKFKKAEDNLKQAIDIITTYHPNPSTGEAHYFCGLASLYLYNDEEAYSLFYKATWNYEWRSAAYYQLACIDCKKENYDIALEHLELSLDTNRQNNKAIVLKAVILNEKGAAALNILQELYDIDPLDQWANYEIAQHAKDESNFIESLRNDAQTIIDIVSNYADAGFYSKALNLLELHHTNLPADCVVPNPMKKSAMTIFIKSWLLHKKGDSDGAIESLKELEESSFDYFFPSRIFEQFVLEWVLQIDSNHSVALYGLGNYYCNLKRLDDAVIVWEKAVESKCTYATVYRNLGIAYWNGNKGKEKAREAYERAVELSPNDMRIQYEYDQLRKKLNDDPKERLADVERIKTQIIDRDDFCVELAALYNFTAQYQKALDLIENRIFHPWEGGEGQVLKQYTHAYLKMGQGALKNGDAQTALDCFNKAFDTPNNLGEKYHPLQAVAHINYWKGMAFSLLGSNDDAKAHFLMSANEKGDFIDMSVSSYSELTYYKFLSLRKLGRLDEANSLLIKMKKHSELKLEQTAKIDYFATSLPLMLVFNDDIQLRNTFESKYLIALAELGLDNNTKGVELLKEVVGLNSMHIGAFEFLSELKII